MCPLLLYVHYLLIYFGPPAKKHSWISPSWKRLLFVSFLPRMFLQSRFCLSRRHAFLGAHWLWQRQIQDQEIRATWYSQSTWDHVSTDSQNRHETISTGILPFSYYSSGVWKDPPRFCTKSMRNLGSDSRSFECTSGTMFEIMPADCLRLRQ